MTVVPTLLQLILSVVSFIRAFKFGLALYAVQNFDMVYRNVVSEAKSRLSGESRPFSLSKLNQ